MSQSNAQSQTMHGYGTQAASSSPAAIEAIEEGRGIKRFPWAAALPAEMLAHFTREVAIVARLRHPHVVQVHAASRFADGTPYVVMERLRGRTLEEALQVGPVPAAELVQILRGIASALSAAHAAGVVHGGLCADTVFLAEMPGYRWGFPKIVDFGIARLGAAGRVDARADQRALVELAIRALGRPLPPAAQRMLEEGTVTSFMEVLEEALAVASVGEAVAAPAVPAPAAANPPSSLTQQFFAEGEAQDVAHAVDDDDLEQNAPTPSVTRVPRNRAQIATVTVLAFGAVAIIVATLVSLSTARDASAPAPAPVVVQRPADVPVSTPRAPAERTGATRTSREPSPAYRERSHQGRTAAPRAPRAEPPKFIPSPVPSATTTPAVPMPAPAAETSAPAAEDSPSENEDDVTAPPEQIENEASTTQ